MKRTGIVLGIVALCIVGAGLLVFMMTAITRGTGANELFTFGRKLELANTERMSVDKADKITISYYSDSITFYQGEGEELVLEEYMNNWDEGMFAEVAKDNGVVSVISGKRPAVRWFGGLQTEIKVYLPKSYHGSLEVSVSSGSMRSGQSFVLDEVNLKSGSGSIHMEGFTAEKGVTASCSSGSLNINRIETKGDCRLSANSGFINLENGIVKTLTGMVSSGSIKIENLEGAMDLSSDSGSIRVSGRGHGKLKSSGGSIKADFKELSGDLEMTSSSGEISLKLPQDLDFSMEANTSSGSIKTDFDDQLSFNKKGNLAKGQIGNGDGPAVRLNASSGGIKVTQ